MTELSNKKTEIAFYFAANGKKLRYSDNREIVVGETHSVDCKPVCCEIGLHASKSIIDALFYAPGSQLYLVELSGEFDYSDDKLCATNRKYIAHFDAEDLLRQFARKQALINIEKIKPYCSESEFNLILEYLKTGKDKLRSAAESAAWSAAWSAESAAWSAASAAWSAAWSAAASAVWSAESAAWAAAWSAEPAANKMLTKMVADATGWDLKEFLNND